MTDALGHMVDLHSELRLLVELTPTGPRTDVEFNRCGILTRESNKAHRQYMAARDRYDGMRRRIGQRAARLERRDDG